MQRKIRIKIMQIHNKIMQIKKKTDNQIQIGILDNDAKFNSCCLLVKDSLKQL